MKISAGLAALALCAAPAFAQNNPPAPKVEDLGSGIQVIFGQGGNIGVSSGPDGAFVIDDQYPNSAAANLAKIKELTGGGPRFLVNTHWHGDHAGGNAAFAGAGPMISPDGENVYFYWSRTGSRVLGVVSINGGPVVEKPLISETYFVLSPDGKQAAYSFYSDQEKRFYVGLNPLESEAPSTIFNIAPTAFLYWPAGSDGLFYRELEPVQGSSSTVMFQPISGGPPRPYLSVEPDFLFDFALGPDGKKAALMRGHLVTDAVLLSRTQRPEN